MGAVASAFVFFVLPHHRAANELTNAWARLKV